MTFLKAVYFSGHIIMLTVLLVGIASLPKSTKSKTEPKTDLVEKVQESESLKENSFDV